MPKIFISYRREDSSYAAGRIKDRLVSRFSAQDVFFDVNSMQFGEDFRRQIETVLKQCSVLLAIIGDEWLEIMKKRSQNKAAGEPKDFVRIEIETALKKGISVIPVLVENAKMPDPKSLPKSLSELAFRHAIEIRASLDFDQQAERLIEHLAASDAARVAGQVTSQDQKPTPKKKPGIMQSLVKQSQPAQNSQVASSTRIFQNIWYREKPQDIKGFFTAYTKSFSSLAGVFKNEAYYDDSGMLVIDDGRINFIGNKVNLAIEKIEKISRGRSGPGIEWVKIEFLQNNEMKTAMFANGKMGGSLTMLGLNNQIFDAIVNENLISKKV